MRPDTASQQLAADGTHTPRPPATMASASAAWPLGQQPATGPEQQQPNGASFGRWTAETVRAATPTVDADVETNVRTSTAVEAEAGRWQLQPGRVLDSQDRMAVERVLAAGPPEHLRPRDTTRDSAWELDTWPTKSAFASKRIRIEEAVRDFNESLARSGPEVQRAVSPIRVGDHVGEMAARWASRAGMSAAMAAEVTEAAASTVPTGAADHGRHGHHTGEDGGDAVELRIYGATVPGVVQAQVELSQGNGTQGRMGEVISAILAQVGQPP